jgi:apolipoprotein N-acyltransferase
MSATALPARVPGVVQGATLVRIGAVLLGSAAYALALPPFDRAGLAWITLVPLLIVLRGSSAQAGFAYGLLYGCGFGWATTWWSVQAVMRYFHLSLPLAVLGMLVFYVAIFAPAFGLFGAGTACLSRKLRAPVAAVAIPCLWVVHELIRDRLVGQPWCLLGYSQHGHPGLIQIASVTGVYGVSFLLVAGNFALATAVLQLRSGRRLRAGIALFSALALVVVIWCAGVIRMRPSLRAWGKTRSIAVVQTGVAPAYEWTRAYAEKQLRAHVAASETITTKPSLIIWPENSITQYLEADPLLGAQLGDLAERHGADLLFGAPRFEDGRTYNSVRLITADGRYGGHYDKQRLVLFAEAGLLADPTPSGPNPSPREFSAGHEPGVLQSVMPIGVSICHEITYPDVIRRSVRDGAELLVNVSNDGWLDPGHGVATWQHLAMATFRAVETRRYVVRAATTGVSAVIDPFGRVVATLAPGTSGVLHAHVTARGHWTPYVRVGDVFALGCLLFVLPMLLPLERWFPRGSRIGLFTRPPLPHRP